MALYTAHYSEIGIKGRNRYLFEDRLISNMRAALSGKMGRMEKLEKRIFFEAEGDEAGIKESLSRIFGIEWYARVYEVKKEKAEIEKFILAHLSKEALKGRTIKVESKRGDKGLPYTSMELSRDIGAAIVEKFGAEVDVRNPGMRIYIEIMQKDRAFVHFEKLRGPGGLPVGSSGRVLALLSGGIDSPVARWMLMRRGAKVVFLHVHPFADAQEAEKSKMAEIAAALAKWQGGATVHLADYSEFYKRTLSIPPKYELVMFRRFIYLLAQELAKKEGAMAVVSGDSLGQVASQTLDNIYAINRGFEFPVFRPLIGMNKSEIMEMAARIGTYELSIKPYKDCCSLVAVQNPETRANADFVRKLEDAMGMGEIVAKTLGKIRTMNVQ
ncbi:tRNA sulfurtransferase [uncultured archaeon]|nr:tRNA sulfurtransferase [uncultured archaeon]